MNRKRRALMAAAAAGFAVLVGIGIAWTVSRTPGPSSTVGREPFAFDAAYADPNPMVLVVRYGDSSSCPSQAVQHVATQQPGQVTVTLTRKRMPAGRVCTTDYGAKLVRITLSAALGSRTVIDGSRSREVPLAPGAPPAG